MKMKTRYGGFFIIHSKLISILIIFNSLIFKVGEGNRGHHNINYS